MKKLPVWQHRRGAWLEQILLFQASRHYPYQKGPILGLKLVVEDQFQVKYFLLEHQKENQLLNDRFG